MMGAETMISRSTVQAVVILISVTLLDKYMWIFTDTILRMNFFSFLFCLVVCLGYENTLLLNSKRVYWILCIMARNMYEVILKAVFLLLNKVQPGWCVSERAIQNECASEEIKI